MITDDGKAVEMNLLPLEKLLKGIKNIPKVTIGIVDDSRNATVGAYHEFGTSRLPARSFLRVPLMTMMKKKIDDDLKFSRDELDAMVKEGNLKILSQEIGQLALEVVHEAFDTNGFGQWPPDKPSTIEHKHSDQVLVETGQLRDSISVVVQ